MLKSIWEPKVNTMFENLILFSVVQLKNVNNEEAALFSWEYACLQFQGPVQISALPSLKHDLVKWFVGVVEASSK
jgi:hypothetical protein